ncbi:hypothetical protein FSLSAGS3026_12080 [Streptococcus agalactiae FSL S3-026]|nr:hypothetical protein FSLSAGS3026_12080 [Streptococcus agalactiae FSL S3-026]
MLIQLVFSFTIVITIGLDMITFRQTKKTIPAIILLYFFHI